MKTYVCTLCGMRYSSEETIQHYDFLHGDRHVICPECRSECKCEKNKKTEESEEGEEN